MKNRKKDLNFIGEIDKMLNDNNIFNVNKIIQKDKKLHEYKDLKELSDIHNIYNSLIKIYKKSIKITLKNVSHIKRIKAMIKNKKVLFGKNKKINDEELFLQIETILAFSLVNFKPNPKLVMPYNYDYHFYKMLFIYIYSIFDIAAGLIYCKFHGQGLSKYELNKQLKAVKFSDPESFVKPQTNLESKIKSYLDSKSFQYIRMLRNSWAHQFENPMDRYHFSIDIMILIILICHLIKIIDENL